MLVWLDIETFSRVDLGDVGAYRYAEDESTKVLLLGYALDDQPAKVWDLTLTPQCPADLSAALKDPKVVLLAHNSMFDRNVLGRKVKEFAPYLEPDRWADSMVQAYSTSLPGALGQLSVVLGLPEDKAKDHDGKRLVLKFCKPGIGGKIRDRTTDPEDWAKYVNYCRKDVEAMRDTVKRLPSWNSRKTSLWDDWHLDQKINDRGVPIDIATVKNALIVAEEQKNLANERIRERTFGKLQTTGQAKALLDYIKNEYGVELKDCTKSVLQEALRKSDIPEDVKDLISIRLGAAVVSVQKYKAMDRMICKDGTVKGTTQFMGATRTGRWAGRGLQMQNVARGMFKSPEEVEMAIDAINTHSVGFLYSDPNRVLSSCLRGMVKAPEGEKLVVADLSNIEGRMLAWLAGEEWKIKAFKLFDQGKGPDLYKATYARAFGIKPEDVTKDQRQIGKVMELALGYQGGVGAFLSFATLYGVDLDALAVLTKKAVSDVDWSRSTSTYEWAVENKMTQGLHKDAYIACDALKNAWRAAHPNVVRLWAELAGACQRAVAYEEEAQIGPLTVKMLADRWLGVQLPSGRCLVYPGARLPKEDEQCAVVFQGVDQLTRKWSLLRTFGGKLVENVVQATSRDILMCGLRNAEDKGFKVRFHVHDEIVATVPKDSPLGVDQLAECMTTVDKWAEGLPLAAAGFEADRYRKD